MKLSTKGRYGTRAMLDLALNRDGGPVSSKDIAERQDLSRGYLEQLLLRLASRGLVRPVRGRGGGFVLSKEPSQITLAEIVEALEGPIDVVECAEGPAVCDRASYCVTREVWAGVSDAITRHLSGITLAEMAKLQSEKEHAGAMTYVI
ncbi:MAG: Rrf2 family transcriptional regulator [Gemmatimonadetes bacterium]|nr:Rrf2 family transcriptional regulator [Gemmatimonadota bacterium]